MLPLHAASTAVTCALQMKHRWTGGNLHFQALTNVIFITTLVQTDAQMKRKKPRLAGARDRTYVRHL